VALLLPIMPRPPCAELADPAKRNESTPRPKRSMLPPKPSTPPPGLASGEDIPGSNRCGPVAGEPGTLIDAALRARELALAVPGLVPLAVLGRNFFPGVVAVVVTAAMSSDAAVDPAAANAAATPRVGAAVGGLVERGRSSLMGNSALVANTASATARPLRLLAANPEAPRDASAAEDCFWFS